MGLSEWKHCRRCFNVNSIALSSSWSGGSCIWSKSLRIILCFNSKSFRHLLTLLKVWITATASLVSERLNPCRYRLITFQMVKLLTEELGIKVEARIEQVLPQPFKRNRLEHKTREPLCSSWLDFSFPCKRRYPFEWQCGQDLEEISMQDFGKSSSLTILCQWACKTGHKWAFKLGHLGK